MLILLIFIFFTKFSNKSPSHFSPSRFKSVLFSLYNCTSKFFSFFCFVILPELPKPYMDEMRAVEKVKPPTKNVLLKQPPGGKWATIPLKESSVLTKRRSVPIVGWRKIDKMGHFKNKNIFPFNTKQPKLTKRRSVSLICWQNWGVWGKWSVNYNPEWGNMPKYGQRGQWGWIKIFVTGFALPSPNWWVYQWVISSTLV